MADSKERQPISIHGFIEQTAQMIRNAVKAPSKKKRRISKEDGLSASNKIKQIAKMLRSEAEKHPPSKKKK